MGLSTTLSNALSGLSTVQSGLDVVSRNVSNSGTPGYNKESVNVIDQTGTSSNYAISSTISRAFDKSLQDYYTNETSDSGFSNVKANYLNQLQGYLGMPSDAGSLESVFNNFQTSLNTLTASPDDYSTRATVVSNAQQLASTLNGLTDDIQGLRQQANGQIQSDVDTVNESLGSLAKINQKLADLGTDATSRATLMDQRDRLVSQVAGVVDVNVTYKTDGSVSLATRSGVTLLDEKPSTFSFQPNSNISANSQFSSDPTQNGVGTLILTAPNGTKIDLVQHDVLQSGELAGLLDLRDNTLVQAQNQLDNIAGSLAKAFSTNQTAGTAASNGTASGLSVDISKVQSGDDLMLNYSVGGKAQTVKVLSVTDGSKLPMDYVDSNGVRTVGVDFSGGAASVAGQLQQALGGGLQITGTDAGSTHTLTVLNDGTANTSVSGLKAETTSTGLQDGGLGMSLFVDTGNSAYTGSLDGRGQQQGFAGRITVNSGVIADNSTLVQPTSTSPIGDVDRANYLFEQLNSKNFGEPPSNKSGLGGSLNGTVSGMISQAMDFQGSAAASAQTDSSNHADAMGTITSRMTSEYSVNVNDEMAHLVQLQSAYSANAHVVSVVQDMLNTLMQAMGN